MNERFSKGRMLLVIETQARQRQEEWQWHKFPGELTEATTYAEAESLGYFAIQLHERFNTLVGLKHFIKNWDKQSSAFLRPDQVGTTEEDE